MNKIQFELKFSLLLIRNQIKKNKRLIEKLKKDLKFLQQKETDYEYKLYLSNSDTSSGIS